MLNIADNKGNVMVEVFDSRYDSDMRYVSTHLRHADFDEVYASNGESPHLAVLDSWENSSRRWIMFNKRCVPVAVLGVRPVTRFSDIAIPWLLGTDGLNDMKRFFLQISKPTINEMKVGFTFLVNYVDARYTKALRWLRWCGFTIEEAAPIGALGLPFHKFTMELT